jgi:pimeloyl-ACP methyl ester carboxylesterase
VHAHAVAHGVRIIAIDRPGYGASDDQPGRTLLDWADDVGELADVLGFARFHVIGASGGGPYVAVCALRLPDRVHEAGILCGMGPVDAPGAANGMMVLYRVGLEIAKRFPGFSRPVFALLAPAFRRHPRFFLNRIAAKAAEPDRPFFDDVHCVNVFVDTFREAFRNGWRGAARDGQLYARPWGFRLEDIRARVLLWHGEKDTLVPVAFGRHVASRIPGCEATFYPDEGHFSIALNRADEIVAAFDTG